MPRYQFVSPGAAAGDSIVDVLAQRRAEARQQMLDEVTRQNAEVSRQAQQESIQSSKETRQRQDLEDSAKMWKVGTVPQASPEIMNAARKRGWLGSRPKGTVPQVETTQDFQGGAGPLDAPAEPGQEPVVDKTGGQVGPSSMDYFLGDFKQQKDEDRKNRMGAALSAIMANPKMSQRDVALAIAAASDDPNLDAGFYNLLKEPQKNYLFDEQSGKWSEAPGEGGHITKRDRPPAGPHYGYQFSGTNAEGLPVSMSTGTGRFFQPGEDGNLSPFGGKIGPKPSTTSTNKGAPSAAEFINLAKLAGEAAKESEANNSWTSMLGGAKTEKSAAYNQALNNIVSRTPGATPDVIETFMDILNQEPPETSLNDLVAAHAEVFKPEELEAFRKLLMFSGRH